MQAVCPCCDQVLEFSSSPPRFCSSCGASLPQLTTSDRTQPFETPTQAPLDPTRTTSALPDAIGGYRLLRPLGSGGMGTVYEGEELGSGQKVAIKLIRSEFADSTETIERFRREGRLAGTIVHPRCVFVLAADEEAGRPYIVMELMSGDNLADLVQRRGPLPVAEAVTLILDVIEGIQEMHRGGLIHRDIKPSNCFVDSKGRVKIGDFGLSKSLVKAGSMTRTGAFLGTLLFSPPEQIRGERVDPQTDLYSVAATLYFLLTGRPPFEAEDAASTLASVISDPLTPLRRWRPDLPATLEEVVKCGLARDRACRWRSLEDFRLALLPFIPGTSPGAELSSRFGAFLVDGLLLFPLYLLFAMTLGWYLQTLGMVERFQEFLNNLTSGLLYFVLPEYLWGCTFGKYLFRLRVRTVGRYDRPGLLRSLVRTATFLLLLEIPNLLQHPFLDWIEGLLNSPFLNREILELLLFPFVLIIWLFLIISTMRRTNGFRGPHEFLSGTRVIRLPGQPVRKSVQGRSIAPRMLNMPEEAPLRLGGYTVLVALRWSNSTRLLLAEDGALNRQVWIWMQPQDQPAVPLSRHDVGRATRPRWLVSGKEGEWQWNAFVASEGTSLPDLLFQNGQLAWAETLFLLEQLTDELAAACADGTLPAELSLDQVWVQSVGRIQLLDFPLNEARASPAITLLDRQQRALQLLRELVRRCLECRTVSPTDTASRLRAPLPPYAEKLIKRLIETSSPYATVDELHTSLLAERNRPAEVTRLRRSALLFVQALLLTPGLLWLMAMIPFALLTFFGARSFPLMMGQKVQMKLEKEMPLRSAHLAGSTDLFSQLAAVGLINKNLAEQQMLGPRLKRFEPDLQAFLRSTSGFIRLKIQPNLRDMASDKDIDADALNVPTIVHLIDYFDPTIFTNRFFLGSAGAVICFWPFVWTIWAFFFRGGLSYRLTGIALVQRDGRPAARWRCACRALLVWAPILALLLTSLFLELHRITLYFSTSDSSSTLAWLAWLTWWLAAVLLIAYLWLAQCYPSRGPQDVLAGTYLVPR